MYIHVPGIDPIDDQWPLMIQELTPIYMEGQDVAKGRPGTAAAEHGPHAVTYYLLAIQLRAQVILELGTRLGGSARFWVEACKETKGHVYSVDTGIFDWELPKEDQQYLTRIRHDMLTLAWDRPIDIYFDDASHTYTDVYAALEKYWPYVKTPGVAIIADSQSHPEAKRGAYDWAMKNSVCYFHDARSHGATYFFRPKHPNYYKTDKMYHET